MARNVEVKLRLANAAAARRRAVALAGAEPVVLVQDDSFFACAHGRLKLRQLDDGTAELIHYERPDGTTPRLSDYVRCSVEDAESLREALARALGLIGRVRKRRLLLLIGQTRIHLDTVEGLGDFAELEVVLRDEQTLQEGVAVAEQVLAALGLADAPRVAGAYLDLLARA